MHLDRQQARQYAERALADSTAPDSLVILDDATEEGETYFVFYWTLRSALDGGSPIAGNAPVLVDRRTGTAFVTGTALPTSDYVAAFERFGDPAAAYGEIPCLVRITGWHAGAQEIAATRLLRDMLGLGLPMAKRVVDNVLDGEQPVFRS